MRLKVHRWRRQYGPAHLPSVGTRRAFLDSSPLCWSSSLWRSIHPPRNACRGAAAAAPVLHPPASSASVQEQRAPGTGPSAQPEGEETRRRGRAAPVYRFCGLRLTSSSLHAWSMSLLGWPGVMPEWPLDQSYETAYAKIVPERLNVEQGTGPGAGSKAAGQKGDKVQY